MRENAYGSVHQLICINAPMARRSKLL